MEAKSVRNMQSITAVTNKHTAKLHHVGSLYILTYDAWKLKHKIKSLIVASGWSHIYLLFNKVVHSVLTKHQYTVNNT